MQQFKRPQHLLRIQFEKGYYAFSRGWLTNSYDPSSLAGMEWERGFNAAYFDNLARISKPSKLWVTGANPVGQANIVI